MEGKKGGKGRGVRRGGERGEDRVKRRRVGDRDREVGEGGGGKTEGGWRVGGEWFVVGMGVGGEGWRREGDVERGV